MSKLNRDLSVDNKDKWSSNKTVSFQNITFVSRRMEDHIAHLRQQNHNNSVTTVSQQLCHNNSVTTTVSQQQCHNNGVTTTVSQQQCHNNSVTTTVSHQQCHNNSVTTTVTTTVSQQQCHNNSVTTTVTTTVSQQQCHINSVTTKVTTTVSQQRCHNNSVTTTVSQQQCHNNSVTTTVSQLKICDFSGGFQRVWSPLIYMSATTTHLLFSGELFYLRYDTIPAKRASANVSFYTNNSEMPNFELWHSCRKWAIHVSGVWISTVRTNGKTRDSCSGTNKFSLVWIKIQQMQLYTDIYLLQRYTSCFGCHSTHLQEY